MYQSIRDPPAVYAALLYMLETYTPLCAARNIKSGSDLQNYCKSLAAAKVAAGPWSSSIVR